MKKIALFLFVAVAVIAFGTGTARADRGFWFHSASAGWTTYFNITNTDNVNSYVAVVDFYEMDSTGGGTYLASTSRTVAPGGQWNFNTAPGAAVAATTTTLAIPATLGINATTLATAALDGQRGTVRIYGLTAGSANPTTAFTAATAKGYIHGHTTQANATYSGFDLSTQTQDLGVGATGE